LFLVNYLNKNAVFRKQKIHIVIPSEEIFILFSGVGGGVGFGRWGKIYRIFGNLPKYVCIYCPLCNFAIITEYSLAK